MLKAWNGCKELIHTWIQDEKEELTPIIKEAAKDENIKKKSRN
jgi:hypothetical protein